MSETATSVLAMGLRNAHAMEIQALELLERQASRLEEYPEVQTQIQHHLVQTERQLERLEQCMDALGEEASVMRDTAPAALGDLISPSNTAAEDEVLKSTFANYSFEHYEIAAYKSLLTLCEIATQRSIVPLLQQSLDEEEAMAKWLKDNVSRVTKDYVTKRDRRQPEGKERMKRPVRPDTGGQRGQGGPHDQEQRAPDERDRSKEKQRNDEPRGK